MILQSTYITIHTLAKSMHIRPSRMQTKAEKLGLHINEESELSPEVIRQLLESYTNSPRTGTATRKRAEQLLNELGGVGERTVKPVVQQQSKCTKSKQRKQQGVSKSVPPVVQYLRMLLQLGVQALHSAYFKFVALFVAIGVQMHHSANWFHRVAPEESANWLSSWGYAFMVDLFVLVVTLEGRPRIARTFAGLMFLANLLYFQFWIGFDNTAVAWTKAVSSIVISAVIAYVIYAYTEIFVRTQQTD